MCNSIKNLIQKSKKEPVITKEMSAIPENRRKMSENAASAKQTQLDFQKASLKQERNEHSEKEPSSSAVDRSKSLSGERQASFDDSVNESIRNIPVIDENDDSSSTYSLTEKL